jgi:hypothetical protein
MSKLSNEKNQKIIYAKPQIIAYGSINAITKSDECISSGCQDFEY